MKFFTHQTRIFILIAGLVTALASCSGSDGTAPSAATSSTGTVGILLTDMPADPSLFVSINASIEKAELLGSEEEDRVTLFSGPTKTFDLLRLKNESIPFAFNNNVPIGTYCKIRLTLSDLELVLADNTPNDPNDNETYHPNLPGNGKLDLVAQGCFSVAPNEVITLQIDVDAGNSIHIVANKNGYIFRPVIFVDILNAGFTGKLVRVEGEITEIDEPAQTFLLCDAVPTESLSGMGCLDVFTGADSAFFDNETANGAPRPLEELLENDNLGKTVTVIGWHRNPPEAPVVVEVPEGHYPPPGECRLWDINLEPGQQPPPIDCDDVPAMLPVDTIVVTHEGPQIDPYHPLMALDALAVELGQFLSLEGDVATDADASGFTMNLAPGSPVVSSTPFSVEFQQGGIGFNGTRFVSKTGELLDSTAVVAPLPVQVDGVLEAISGSDDILKAALVIVDTEAVASEQVTGTILDAGTDSLLLDPDAATVCGITTDELAVNLTEDAEILTVIITDENSEILPGGILANGQYVGMSGSCEPAGYETDNVVIVDDQRV